MGLVSMWIPWQSVLGLLLAALFSHVAPGFVSADESVPDRPLLSGRGPSSWNYERQGRDWGQLCQSGQGQSPINLDPANAAQDGKSEVRLLYRPWFQDALEPSPNASVNASASRRVPHIVFRDGVKAGTLQVGPGYDDFDEYTLTRVEVHTPSEHTSQHASWPLELQLWHESLPLSKLPSLERHTTDLMEGGKVVDSKLSTIDRLVDELKLDVLGKRDALAASRDSYKKNAGKIASTEQILDWIDADKERIEAEVVELKSTTALRLKGVEKLAQETRDLVHAEKRPLASSRVVLSLFFRHSALGGAQGAESSRLLRWIADAMVPSFARESAGGTASVGYAVDIVRALGLKTGDTADGDFAGDGEAGRQRRFFAYEGSLTRPPCTPDVRWIVAEEPLVASVEDLELLLEVVRNSVHMGSSGHVGSADYAVAGAAADAVRGNSRVVQPVTSEHQFRFVTVGTNHFEIPELELARQASKSVEKWRSVKKYCIVFLFSAVLLTTTSFVFCALNACEGNAGQGRSLRQGASTVRSESLTKRSSGIISPRVGSFEEPIESERLVVQPVIGDGGRRMSAQAFLRESTKQGTAPEFRDGASEVYDSASPFSGGYVA